MRIRPLSFFLFSLLAVFLLTACSGVSTAWHGVGADANLAYISAGSYIYAVRLSDGTEAWRYPEKANGKTIFYAPPVLTDDGQLLVGSAGTDHALYYLNAQTGAYKDQFDGALARWVASPLVLDGYVYAPGGDGILYLLDMQGNRLKSFDTGAPLWSQPVTDGKYIYLAGLNHHLYALEPQTLKIIWDKDLGGALAGSPALSPDGVLYIGSFGSKVTAIEAASGKTLWEAPTEGAVWGGPALHADLVYAADLKGKIYAFNAKSGERHWQPIRPDGPILASPLLWQDMMIFTTETGAVVGVDADGKVKTLSAYQGKIYAPVVGAGDLILVAPLGTDFLLAAVDANGLQAWTFVPEKK
ncbi:MAG: outer membrane protein assembly factor BamB family protein [Candidatus Villigracilaceae bacterium]